MKKNDHPEKTITTMRLSGDLIAALDAAAADDNRSRTSMFIKILSEWLKRRGYLK